MDTMNNNNNNNDKNRRVRTSRSSCSCRSRGYSTYTLIKDLLTVGILISLAVMNYLNMSVVNLFDDAATSSSNYMHDHFSVPITTPIHEVVASTESTKTSSKQESSTTSTTISSSSSSKFHHRRTSKKLNQPRRVSSSVMKDGEGTSNPKTITTTSNDNNNNFIVNENDYIYSSSCYDCAPIVVKEYKLLFFSVPKVACTTFKFLFRRIQGVKDWDNQDSDYGLPHNPKYNNLKYLSDYSLQEASEMMTNPEWTKAIFVRDPKERFLSAFLDKGLGNFGIFTTEVCCTDAMQCKIDNYDNNTDLEQVLVGKCQEEIWDSRRSQFGIKWLEDRPCCTLFKECNERITTVEGFLSAIEECPNGHWIPQNERMENKYWKYINFVGHMSNMKDDTEKLLKRVGAWDEYGQTGWGPYRNESIVQGSSPSSSSGSATQNHATGSSNKIHQWYNPENERLVEKFYADDYKNELFDFKIVNLTQPVNGGKVLKSSDTIYRRDDWDAAPIVVEKYKLIFFTLPHIAATKWKQSFRRMEQLDDWKDIGGPKGLPHDPEQNDLKYLYDFPLKEAEDMMTNPEWTKAIFVRSPKDRFLSIFYYMSRNREHVDNRCCPHRPGCSSALDDMPSFIELMQTCFSIHWAPFSERFDERWWSHINFIGKIENIDIDSEKLLKKIGAWELIGENGWGGDGKEPIFIKDEKFASVHDSLGRYSPKADKLLDAFYKADYENKYLNFTSKKVYVMEH